jgi:hypothetical protein
MSDQETHDQAAAPEPMPRLSDAEVQSEPEPRPLSRSETFIKGDPERAAAEEASSGVAVAEREVDPAEALEEAKRQDITRVEREKSDEAEKQKDVVDILVPKSEPKTWVIGPQDGGLTFVQKRLSFIGKMQWFALVGGVLDKALAQGGVSINELLSTPGQRGQQLSAADLRDADTFVRAIGKLMVYAPDFLLDSYVIWLAVPELQRNLVKDLMSMPEEEGGLSDEQGLEMIEIFIDQNFDALADFFGDKIGALRKRVEQRIEARSKKRVK